MVKKCVCENWNNSVMFTVERNSVWLFKVVRKNCERKNMKNFI